MSLHLLGRCLVGLGLTIALIGLAITFGGRLGLGRLPGDILVNRGRVTFFFPIVTCLVISAALTILFTLLERWRR